MSHQQLNREEAIRQFACVAAVARLLYARSAEQDSVAAFYRDCQKAIGGRLIFKVLHP